MPSHTEGDIEEAFVGVRYTFTGFTDNDTAELSTEESIDKRQQLLVVEKPVGGHVGRCRWVAHARNSRRDTGARLLLDNILLLHLHGVQKMPEEFMSILLVELLVLVVLLGQFSEQLA